MAELKVIYIAGKYRDSRGEYYVRTNIREAERYALLVWKYGGVAVCPHKNTAGFGGALGISDDTWLKGDLELLKRCDALYAIPSWVCSEGTKAEIQFAQENHIPVLYNEKDVWEFIEA